MHAVATVSASGEVAAQRFGLPLLLAQQLNGYSCRVGILQGTPGSSHARTSSRRIDACYSRDLVDVPNYDDKDDLRNHPVEL